MSKKLTNIKSKSDEMLGGKVLSLMILLLSFGYGIAHIYSQGVYRAYFFSSIDEKVIRTSNESEDSFGVPIFLNKTALIEYIENGKRIDKEDGSRIEDCYLIRSKTLKFRIYEYPLIKGEEVAVFKYVAYYKGGEHNVYGFIFVRNLKDL